MHKRGLCRHAVCVCVSVTFVSCVKTYKDIFEIFSPSGCQAILVFPCQTGWRYSNLNLPNGGVECRWGRQKRDSERISLHALHTGLQCCKPYESRSVKNKAATDGVEQSTHGGVRRRCSHKTTTMCLWRARHYMPETEVNPLPPSDTTPLVITPFSDAIGHRRTEPGGYLCWKLTLTCTPHPIWPRRRGPDPNRSTNGRKQGGYNLGVFVWGVLVGHCRRQ